MNNAHEGELRDGARAGDPPAAGVTGDERGAASAPASEAGSARRGGALRWLWCSLAVVIADQSTKLAAVGLLDRASAVELLPVLDLVLVYNPGAAFSILSTAGGWQRWLFIGLALAICGFIVHWLRDLPRGARRLPLALSLILGGAAGNVVDRVRIGAVVDFIDFHVGDWHWPAFNVADSAICIGAALLVLGVLRSEGE